MLNTVNVATPAEAITVFVPLSVPLAGLVPMANVTVSDADGIKLPLAS